MNVIWKELIEEGRSCVKSVAISPDGEHLIAAVNKHVLLYNTNDGTLVDSLLGHKDVVNSVDFSSDGTRFASGGADGTVVIWKRSGEGLLKYTHSGPIQCVRFRPASLKLISCSETDFGCWSPQQKQVIKVKEHSKIQTITWSPNDSGIFALGTQSGVISIRSGDDAVELQRIDRKVSIQALLFLPDAKGLIQATSSNENDTLTLLVGSWDKTLSLYQIRKDNCILIYEKSLKFYPTSLSLAGNHSKKGNAFIMSGSNGKCSLYSREGLPLLDLASKEGWLWSHAYHASADRLLVGTDRGELDFRQVNFGSVYSIYADKFAFQENLTEVIIHNLNVGKKVRIKCKDLVRRLSTYQNKLAVQLSDRVCVYEASSQDPSDMHYHLRKERINISEDMEITHMMMATSHLLFFKSTLVELYSFDCVRRRLWNLDSPVTCVTPNGGSMGKETFLLGCKDGSIWKLFIDNPFATSLGKRPNAIRSIDVNITRTNILVVDSSNSLAVINARTQQVLFTANGALRACFNTEIDDVLCYSVNNDSAILVSIAPTKTPSIRDTAGDIQSQENTIAQMTEISTPGLLLGFQNNKVLCFVDGNTIETVDVPLTSNIIKAIQLEDYDTAYTLASKGGATDSDWKMLASRALCANHLLVAKKSYAKLKDMKYLTFIEQVERSTIGSGLPSVSDALRPSHSIGYKGVSLGLSDQLDPAWHAELLAYEGYPLEAARAYTRIGKSDEALRVLTDLRLWEDAKTFAQSAGYDSTHQAELITRQAQWLITIQDWKSAADLYISLGQNFLGAKLVGDAQDEGWDSFLIDVVRRLPVDSGLETLIYCAEKFDQMDKFDYAIETYHKIGNVSKLMTLYTKRQMWIEAVSLAESNPGKFDITVFLPYADWLVSQNRFEDGLLAYKNAGRIDMGISCMEDLVMNCIIEKRFKDAAYYCWKISVECSSVRDQSVYSSIEYKIRADVYYAYSTIHSFITEPFSSHQSETLFNVSRFIINSITAFKSVPQGVSEALTLYTLGREAMNLGVFKLARQVYDKLSKLQLGINKHEEVELNMLMVQAKPVRDDPGLLPVCYRCAAVNPFLNPFTERQSGDVCINCGHSFIRSFINFDILPLVEFIPQNDIDYDEAINLIRRRQSDTIVTDSNQCDDEEKLKRNMTLQWRGHEPDKSKFDDLFVQCINRTLDKQMEKVYLPVVVDAATLGSLNSSEVYVCKSADGKYSFYRNMMPDKCKIALSEPCQKFFKLEDFELSYLSNLKCPYSRLGNIGYYHSL